MKKLLISLLFTTFASTALAESYVCVTQRTDDIGYASRVMYEGYCQNGDQFETKPNVTMFLLPIPYKWGAVAYSRMNSQMTKSGYKQLSSIKLGSEHYPFYVYGARATIKETFCIVEKSNSQASGINGAVETSDISIKCDNDSDEYQAGRVTDADLEKYMEKQGYKKRFNFKEVYYNIGKKIGDAFEVYSKVK